MALDKPKKRFRAPDYSEEEIQIIKSGFIKHSITLSAKHSNLSVYFGAPKMGDVLYNPTTCTRKHSLTSTLSVPQGIVETLAVLLASVRLCNVRLTALFAISANIMFLCDQASSILTVSALLALTTFLCGRYRSFDLCSHKFANR